MIILKSHNATLMNYMGTMMVKKIIKNFLRAKKRQRDALKNFDVEASIARSHAELDRFKKETDAARKPTAAQKKFADVIGTCLWAMQHGDKIPLSGNTSDLPFTLIDDNAVPAGALKHFWIDDQITTNLEAIWRHQFSVMNFFKLASFEIPDVKEIDKIKTQIEKLQYTLEAHNSGQFDELWSELGMAQSKLNNWIKLKKQKRQKDQKYPESLVLVARHLINIWDGWTNLTGKTPPRINASRYKSKSQKGTGSTKLNEYLQTIPVDENPGGAFMQRVLDKYFDQKLNNNQLQTLLDKAYKPDALGSKIVQPENNMRAFRKKKTKSKT